MSRVVIAGTGPLALQLQKHLTGHEVRLTQGFDLTLRHDAELALTGAEVVVVLASARGPQGRLKTASRRDLDALLADSLGRAAKLVGAQRVIVFACGDDDARLPVLEKCGVPLAVLRGGGPDPIAALAAMVNGGEAPPASAWSGAPSQRDTPRWSVCSVQRLSLPAGWDALKLARAHFEWLPTAAPLTRVSLLNRVASISIAGSRALVLSMVPGRSDATCAHYEIVGGSLAARAEGRLEFRVLLDGTAVAALIGYQPALPFFVYRFSQALVHERTMRKFTAWLSTQA